MSVKCLRDLETKSLPETKLKTKGKNKASGRKSWARKHGIKLDVSSRVWIQIIEITYCQLEYIGGFFTAEPPGKLQEDICMCVLGHFSRVWLSAPPWTAVCRAPLSMEFSRQEDWLTCPPPGDLPDPGIKPMSLISPALAGGFFTTSATWEAQEDIQYILIILLKFCKWGCTTFFFQCLLSSEPPSSLTYLLLSLCKLFSEAGIDKLFTTCWPNPAHYLFVWLRFYWNKITSIILFVVYGSFCALMAELNNHKRDPLAHKAQNIYHRGLCRNSLSALKNSLGNCYTFSHIILFSGGSYFSSEIVDLLL